MGSLPSSQMPSPSRLKDPVGPAAQHSPPMLPGRLLLSRPAPTTMGPRSASPGSGAPVLTSHLLHALSPGPDHLPSDPTWQSDAATKRVGTFFPCLRAHSDPRTSLSWAGWEPLSSPGCSYCFALKERIHVTDHTKQQVMQSHFHSPFSSVCDYKGLGSWGGVRTARARASPYRSLAV